MAIIERIVTVYNDKGSKQAVKDLNKLEKNFADAGKKIAKAFAVATAAAGATANALAIFLPASAKFFSNLLRSLTACFEPLSL